jgi:hypothetical protein
LGKTRHGFQNHGKQQINGFKNHGHELNYGNLILQDRKIFGNYFYFKYIIPKYLMRIWINGIRFEGV